MENFYFEQCKDFLQRVTASKNVLSGAAQNNIKYLRQYARLLKSEDHKSEITSMIEKRLANIESKAPAAVVEYFKVYTSEENYRSGEKWRLLCRVYADINGRMPVRPMAAIYQASQSKNQ